MAALHNIAVTGTRDAVQILPHAAAGSRTNPLWGSSVLVKSLPVIKPYIEIWHSITYSLVRRPDLSETIRRVGIIIRYNFKRFC
jgi:hypothetical protein